MTDTPSRVRAIITEHLGVDESAVIDTALLAEDLGADSLDVVELTMAIEDDFDTSVPDHESAEWKTPGDIIKTVERLTA